MIGANSVLHCSTHNYKNHPMWIDRVDRPIQIGIHVWIGTNVTICCGVKVGNYSVIGAGSVITKHVPEYAIIAGNPARIIRFRDEKWIASQKQIPKYPSNSKIVKEGFLNINNHYATN